MIDKNKQLDFFSLFEEENVSVQQFEVGNRNTQSEHKKGSTLQEKPTMNSSVVEKKDKFDLTTETLINFMGHSYPITDYFSIAEIQHGIEKKKKDEVSYEKITEEDLRKRLEKHFPVLVRDLTTLAYIKKKDLIVPILQAKKKGQLIDSAPSYAIDLVRQKKISFSLFRDFVIVAKKISDKYGSEVHADIYFDLRKNEYFMDFPEQTIHPLWTEVSEEPAVTARKFLDKQYVKVMEIHSHHIMPAIPSATDDLAERTSLLYAIVGNIEDFYPSVTVRTFDIKTNKHVKINVSDVFKSYYEMSPTNQYKLDGISVKRHD
ncbi:MPN domain-containing protein [Bacillus swezeyi]|uniref:Uncharacterized protein n=1 Tax=Bacillus swezeyi TaxID=1925020 RepID=A0A5M8RIV9_9BACI|nr:hypothetical protein [Bacillus swezeyi]KAA6447003.1 hypothetical protein DX927_23460 [Bacillus swezeyi]KAA6471571.1 hypothetical protein DX928_23700 [Bacillus swezeyi]